MHCMNETAHFFRLMKHIHQKYFIIVFTKQSTHFVLYLNTGYLELNAVNKQDNSNVFSETCRVKCCYELK